MEENQRTISQLFSDVGTRAAGLADAQFALFRLEMREKFSSLGHAGLWLAVGGLMLVAAVALALVALVLFAVHQGVSPDAAAAGLALFLAIAGLLVAWHGASLLRGFQITPVRTLAQMRPGLAERSDADA